MLDAPTLAEAGRVYMWGQGVLHTLPDCGQIEIGVHLGLQQSGALDQFEHEFRAHWSR